MCFLYIYFKGKQHFGSSRTDVPSAWRDSAGVYTSHAYLHCKDQCVGGDLLWETALVWRPWSRSSVPYFIGNLLVTKAWVISLLSAGKEVSVGFKEEKFLDTLWSEPKYTFIAMVHLGPGRTVAHGSFQCLQATQLQLISAGWERGWCY